MDVRVPARLPRNAVRLRMLVARAGALFAVLALSLAAHPESASAKRRLDPLERRVIRLVNVNRANAGLRPLHASRILSRSADTHSRDMARRGFFAHASSSGQSFKVRIRKFSNARRLGENLAYVPRKGGRKVAQQIVSMWMNSPEHREIILSPGFKRIGVARRTGHIGRLRATVFTADFASRP